MEYGICSLTLVPMRAEPSDRSELVNQLLFGESFRVVDRKKDWLRVELAHDQYQGWVDAKQVFLIEKAEFDTLQKAPAFYSGAPVDLLQGSSDDNMTLIVQSSPLPHFTKGKSIHIAGNQYKPPAEIVEGKGVKGDLAKWAYSYLNAPYLWGGRSHFGIDCSGFTQSVYRLAGYSLPRDSADQAGLGETLSFIEEAEPGDLAFFDNEEGNIVHVGILLNDNFIIHASGKVRVDRLDQSGIYNADQRRHTHHLRVIKRIV